MVNVERDKSLPFLKTQFYYHPQPTRERENKTVLSIKNFVFFLRREKHYITSCACTFKQFFLILILIDFSFFIKEERRKWLLQGKNLKKRLFFIYFIFIGFLSVQILAKLDLDSSNLFGTFWNVRFMYCFLSLQIFTLPEEWNGLQTYRYVKVFKWFNL